MASTQDRSSLERYVILQDLVYKKTRVSLEFSKFDKVLLNQSWSNRENPHSLYTKISSHEFWGHVEQDLLEGSDEIIIPTLNSLITAYPGLLQMAILNLDTLNNMDEYLSQLGRLLHRVFGVDPNHILQFSSLVLDTVIHFLDLDQDHYQRTIKIWESLIHFIAQTMINAMHEVPQLLISTSDPFQTPQIDVDLIIQKHFSNQEPVRLESLPEKQEIIPQEQDDDDDDDDEADVYDIFSVQAPRPSRKHSISTKSHALTLRKPTKKLGLLKRAVKSVLK